MRYSYRRLKSPDAYHRKLNRPCGRRTSVIHNHGMSSTAIHKASNIHVCRFPPGNRTGACQHASKTKKGRPAEASLPCKNLESRISAQQHRRNGKSIQCPSNVTTYLGHTLFVGSTLKLFLLLCNYAQQSGNRKPKPADVPYLSQLLLCDRKNHENVSSCTKRAVCLFDCVRLQRKCGVSTLYFA